MVSEFFYRDPAARVKDLLSDGWRIMLEWQVLSGWGKYSCLGRVVACEPDTGRQVFLSALGVRRPSGRPLREVVSFSAATEAALRKKIEEYGERMIQPLGLSDDDFRSIDEKYYAVPQ